MSEPIQVDDPDDPRLADYRGLRDPTHRQRYEAEQGVFVAEGVVTIRSLVRSPYAVRSVLVTPVRWRALADDLKATNAPVYIAPKPVLADVTHFAIHRGAVAVGQRQTLPDPATLLPTATRVAVLEGLNDHENIGALFRNAAAFGIDAVLLDPTCADPLYRRSVRVSLGHVLHVPFARLNTWPGGLAMLRSLGFTLVALTPDEDAEPIDELAADPPTRTAVLLGAEGPGLSDAAMTAADRRVRIPMVSGVDSINVAAAAAVAFHRLGVGDRAAKGTRLFR
ncbi:MAG: TrmH family RNA methyltransferase [Acidimicrobiales bacterium]